MVPSIFFRLVSRFSTLDRSTAQFKCYGINNERRASTHVSIMFITFYNSVLPQTLAVLKTRAKGFGIWLVVGNAPTALGDEKLRSELCRVLLHCPDVNGQIKDFGSLADSVHAANALVAVSTDLLALTMGSECSADIVFGNSARFGVPAGYSGPHG